MLGVTRSSLLLAGFSGLLLAQQQQPQWWNLSTAVQHQPAPRKNAATAVNYTTGHIVLFGGTGASGDLNDTWLWNGTDWVQPSLATSPPPMAWARMVYDSFNRRNVLVGYSSGLSNPGPQTWFWDGVTWTQSTASNPNISRGFSLAYDESSHDAIVFGGEQSSSSSQRPSDDTWAFNGSTWDWLGGSFPPSPAGPVPAASASSTFASPPARSYAAMTWDRVRQKVVLFSGYNDTLSPTSLTDTWVWIDRTTGWQQQSGANPTTNWSGYQAAPFVLGGYLLAVGFPAGTRTAAETWRWDGANWTLVDTLGPPVSEGFSISEDPLYGGVLLFGGTNVGALSDQTWGWGQLPVPLDKAPVAKISAVTTVPCTAPSGTSVAFDGGQSYDPDGQPIVSYQWTGPLNTVFGRTASLMLPIGLSTVKLAVSDGQLVGSAIAAVTVTVGVDGLESPLGPLVPEPGSASLPTVSFETGRTLPLKLGLACGTWKLSSNEVRPPRLVSIQSLGVPVAGAIGAVPGASSTDSGGLFRSENTNWIYNLSTQGMTPGLYAVIIEMPDGLRYRTLISLR